MFDLGAAELLVIVIVAVIVIGPKDLPLAMRTAGRWIGQVRKVSAHFRTGLDAMVREAELEDMEKKWKAQNEEIMKRQSGAAEDAAGEPVMTGPPPVAPKTSAEAPKAHAPEAGAEARVEGAPKAAAPAAPEAAEFKSKPKSSATEPELPLAARKAGKSTSKTDD